MSNTLTPRQLKAVEALLTHASVKDAAGACGVSRSTLHNWLNDSTFLDTLKKREAELLAGSSRRLASLTAEALEVLAGVMHDDIASDNARIRAAEAVLSKYSTLKDAFTFEARLDALEAQINAHR